MALLHRVSAFLALAVFALAPVPFGSTELVWQCVWIGLLALSLCIADLRFLTRAQKVLMGVAASILMLTVVVVWLQLSDFFPAQRAGIWMDAANLLNEALPSRPSLTASQPILALGPSILMTLAFMRAVVLGSEPGGAATIRRTVGYAATFIALYSLTMFLLAPHSLLWRAKEFHLGGLTGTFTNRNTAASLFGVGVMIWTLRVAAEWRVRSQYGADKGSRLKLTPAVACLALCLLALAATGSRAGVVLSLAATALALVVYASHHCVRRVQPLHVALVLAVLLLLAVLWSGRLSARFSAEGVTDSGRWLVYRTVLDMIADRPWLGIGLGNFEIVFPTYRPAALGSAGIWTKAHNTPLELMVELGLPAALAILAFAGWLMILLWRKALASRDRAILLGAAASLFAALHALVDFSLQIPGMAIVFAAIVGAGVARALSADGALNR